MIETASDRMDVLLADPGFADLLEELSHRIQSGDGVDLTDYLTRYPQYQDQLEKLIPAMQALVGIGQGSPAAEPAEGTAGAMGGTLGDFRILREIGRGGMGVVYEAEQISLRRRVALKVLPFAGMLDRRQLQRFQNEARAAATLHHPHVVPIYFVGMERGVHFYAMQLVAGQTLAQMIHELRRLGDQPVDAKGGSQLTRGGMDGDTASLSQSGERLRCGQSVRLEESTFPITGRAREWRPRRAREDLTDRIQPVLRCLAESVYA